MAKKRRRALPVNYPLSLSEIVKDGSVEEKIKSHFEQIEVIRRQQKRVLEGLRIDYEKTLNPLAAWDAFLFAQELNVPIPEWVLKYLRSTAKLLMRVDNTTRDLAWCFGLDSEGGPGPWKTYRSYRIRLEALSHVVTQINQGTDRSVDDICSEAACIVESKWGVEVNFETVRQWFYRNASEWKKPAVSGCTARPGYPTVLTRDNHSLLEGDIVELSGATGPDAQLLNGQTLPVCFVTRDTFAVAINTMGAEPMGNGIIAAP